LRHVDVIVGANHAGGRLDDQRYKLIGLIDDQPCRRAYVVLKPGAKDSFVAKAGN